MLDVLKEDDAYAIHRGISVLFVEVGSVLSRTLEYSAEVQLLNMTSGTVEGKWDRQMVVNNPERENNTPLVTMRESDFVL